MTLCRLQHLTAMNDGMAWLGVSKDAVVRRKLVVRDGGGSNMAGRARGAQVERWRGGCVERVGKVEGV